MFSLTTIQSEQCFSANSAKFQQAERGHGEEVGDNGLEPQAPVKSVLHKVVAEAVRGVAREWEDRMAESKRPKSQ